VAKPEWGTKRDCTECGARFYDLNRVPAACPKCGAVFEVRAEKAAPRSEERPAPPPAAKAPKASKTSKTSKEGADGGDFEMIDEESEDIDDIEIDEDGDDEDEVTS
jgi:uncharacterized protein (TIGR02300 family)